MMLWLCSRAMDNLREKGRPKILSFATICTKKSLSAA